MAAPICWSANGESRIPDKWSYTEYHGAEDKMLSDIARRIITPFVARIAQIPPRVESFGFIGWEGMSCIQNKTPVTKNEECISQMWTA